MENGIQTRLVALTLDETVDRIKAALKERGIKLFCVIDHSGEAEAVGLKMPRTKLLIFGNAKAGTPLMLATPSAAIDLPLKLLVAEQTDGSVAVSWNQPDWLQRRHGFGTEFTVNLGAAESIAQVLAGKSGKGETL